MKPQTLPNAAETATTKLAELEIDLPSAGAPVDAGAPEGVGKPADAGQPKLPEAVAEAGVEVTLPEMMPLLEDFIVTPGAAADVDLPDAVDIELPVDMLPEFITFDIG